MYLYSPTTGGFYLEGELHAPADALAVTEAEHAALFAAQATGKRIMPGPDGAPVAADPPAPPPPSAAEMVALRDARLQACDWTQLPDVPLADATKAAWAEYRKALRAVPEQPGFPAAIEWPAPPA